MTKSQPLHEYEIESLSHKTIDRKHNNHTLFNVTHCNIQHFSIYFPDLYSYSVYSALEDYFSLFPAIPFTILDKRRAYNILHFTISYISRVSFFICLSVTYFLSYLIIILYFCITVKCVCLKISYL
jgi:hypothetical protein